MFHYCNIFNKIAVCFQCVIADNSGDILTIVKGLKNMQIIKNLCHLVGKTKVEISNMIYIYNDKQMRINKIFKQIILYI